MKEKETSLSVMVVDNEESFLQLFKHQCRRTKDLMLSIYDFTNWSEAKQHLDDSIDILILDYFLTNDLLAVDIVKSIRETNRHLPILLITACVSNELTANAFAVGADDLLDKTKISSHSIEGILRRTYLRASQTEKRYANYNF